VKAIRVSRFGGPEVLMPELLPDLTPGPGQVRIRVKAIGVNPVETYVRSGMYPRTPPLPYTPGADAAGLIDALGAGVKGFKKGDRVYTSGTVTGSYADITVCNVPQVHPLPDKTSFEQGAALGVPYATAYQALFHRAKARAGETVLIHGASGGVGIAAVQLARAAGLHVVGTSGTKEGRKLILKEGAHEALAHEESSGRTYDVIIEMLANVNLGRDLGLLSPFGRVVVVGSRGKVEIDPRETMSRDAAVLGMTLFNATESDLRAIHSALFAGLENGTLRPVIGKKFKLDDAPKAHEAVMASGARGKIVLIP
jgi:NADPH2:quinone reductase